MLVIYWDVLPVHRQSLIQVLDTVLTGGLTNYFSVVCLTSCCYIVFADMSVCLSVCLDGVVAIGQCSSWGIHSNVYDLSQTSCNGHYPVCHHWNVCTTITTTITTTTTTTTTTATMAVIHFVAGAMYIDLGVGSIKSTHVDSGFTSRVKSVCSSVTVKIFWRRRFHYKSFQVDLRWWWWWWRMNQL